MDRSHRQITPWRCHCPNVGTEQRQVPLMLPVQVPDTLWDPTMALLEADTTSPNYGACFFTCYLLCQVPDWPLMAEVKTTCLGSRESKSLGSQVEGVSSSCQDS